MVLFMESDSHAGEVLSQPVSPADILATLYHNMGIDRTTELRDRLDRPMQLSDGRVLHECM